MLQAREFRNESGDEDENEDEDAPPLQSAEARRAGFHSFQPKLSGVLFKIDPLSEELSTDIDRYMKEGFMQRDLAFVDTLYGLVAPSQRKDFSMFWESPWVEEHIHDAAKKRKVEQQQRTLAVRSFIKASTAQPEDRDVDQFLNTVSKLTDWDYTGEDKAHESIKTVSRMVQSFEKKAVLTILSFLESGPVKYPIALQHMNRLRGGSSLGDIDPITHALRRAPYTYVAFASLVSSELLLSEGTNGSRNTTINMSRRMDLEKFNALNTMIDKLQKATVSVLPKDTLGIPLMHTTFNVCVSRGILLVSGKSAPKATYVLDIDNLDEIMQKRKKRKTPGGDVLEITAHIFEDGERQQQPAKAKNKGKGKQQAAPSLSDLVPGQD